MKSHLRLLTDLDDLHDSIHAHASNPDASHASLKALTARYHLAAISLLGYAYASEDVKGYKAPENAPTAKELDAMLGELDA